MEIVVRTPHGDADVSIVSSAPITTLADVVAAVTGQAVPRLVRVDDRVVDAATLLDESGLVLGSVITPEPPCPLALSDADVDLVQLAGHGAGRVARLGPGRYRIGPGRRASADELTVSPVENTMFELVVEPTVATSTATLVGHHADIALDGAPLDAERRWTDGTLTVGSRAFQLDSPARSDPKRLLSPPERDGTVAFSRPPRRRSAPVRRPVVDAVRDAALAAPTLWERRPSHPDAFTLPIGVRLGPHDGFVTVDLGAERAIAVSGSERFRAALARTLVVEAATLHGPADLDLVVLTDPDRLAAWDWAKWLPHLRLDGPPAIWSSRSDITRWADGFSGRAVLATTSWMASHLTLAIIDDPGLWSRRDAPLRSIVSNPPPDLRMIALCDDAALAPAVCTTMISETAHDRAHLQSFTRSDDIGEFLPALTETAVAVRVARSIAPLADVDLPAPAAPRPGSTGPGSTGPGSTANGSTANGHERTELADLIDVADADDIVARWAAGAPRPTVAIGWCDGDVVDVPVADDVTVVTGPSIDDAFDMAATWLLGQAVEYPPDQLWIAPIVQVSSSRAAWLWQLPHATDPHELNSTVDVGRLLTRLRRVIADPQGPARVVVVVEALRASSTRADAAWLRALADGVHSMTGLALVVITDRADLDTGAADPIAVDTVVGIGIGIDIDIGEPTSTGGSQPGRVATLTTRDGQPVRRFVPLQRTPAASSGLELRPYVVGRALAPLERRIEQQQTAATGVIDPAIRSLANMLSEALSRDPQARRQPQSDRTVLPPPMPGRVELEELFAASPGDGVPLGLTEGFDSDGFQVRWWEPGCGSMLVYGSRRSGMEQVLATIALGIVDRFSELDVRLITIEPSPARRRALEAVDRSIGVAAPDRSDEVDAVLDEIESAVTAPGALRDGASVNDRRLVVLVGDLVSLRRRHATQPLGARIDTVLSLAAAADSGVDVIASTTELAASGPFATLAIQRLVGVSSDHAELVALGVEQPGELDGTPGRCRSFPDGYLVQLALASTPTETLLARRAIGGTP